jgi:hypothetical protein
MAMSDESKFCEARNMAQRLEGHVVVESELLPVPLAASSDRSRERRADGAAALASRSITNSGCGRSFF